jgi:hypothetical protein
MQPEEKSLQAQAVAQKPMAGFAIMATLLLNSQTLAQVQKSGYLTLRGKLFIKALSPILCTSRLIWLE